MRSTTSPTTGPIIVVPCSASKVSAATYAHALYTGQHFVHTLRAAITEASACSGRVLILSARYGLLGLDDIVDPYDTTMGDPDAVTVPEVTAQAVALGIDFGVEVYAMLPRAYYRALSAALAPLDVYPQNVYEAARGIGDQRHIASIITTTR